MKPTERPLNPYTGMIWMSDNRIVYKWDGKNWINIVTGKLK